MAGERAKRGDVAVWDWFVRLFHWATVALVAAAFLSPDDKSLHEPIGYVIMGLVAARLVWGLVGTRHARFTDFMARPATVARYLRELWIGKPRRYLGHNPAGGIMVMALLATLVTITVSGWMSETDRYFGVEWVSQLHSVASDVLLGLIACHLLGVLVASLLHRENLIAAMITGRKPVGTPHEDGVVVAAPAPGGTTRR